VITGVDLFGLQQTPDMHRKFTGISANLAYTMVQYLGCARCGAMVTRCDGCNFDAPRLTCKFN
jgi:hypothetical protein